MSSIKEQIRKIARPIFEEVLKETPSNHTMVDKSKKNNELPALYNPHNYRLYFNFDKANFKPKEGMVGVWFGKLKNYGKEFTALGEGVRVTIKRTKAEIINKLTEQEWFSVNKSKAKDEITYILDRINKKCIEGLKKFIEQYGGSSDYIILNQEGRPDLILNTRCDNKVSRESYISSLPPKLTFETKIVKKPYKELNVEYKEAIHAAQFLENSALNDFSPQIANAIDRLAYQQANVMQGFSENIKLHLKVLKGIEKAFNKFNTKLDNTEVMPSKRTNRPKYGLSDEELWKLENLTL